ncbi:glycoside hydrolase family 16 protein [uncultured Prevotella sp.]|uniref:glycoside hydrolase family 16 protein n=1 Tax=uncultured Prevotella sp. TaxID=159272 RepID=UPI00262B6DCC|nr:glycoside hydrolase family 16 protein [uncultured Prevotella sp.]
MKIQVFAFLLFAFAGEVAAVAENDNWELVWSDEFNRDGKPDTAYWNYEQGFVRNYEDQWYQPDNAWQTGGLLVIEGRKERLANPEYNAGSDDWRHGREFAEYTSASLNTAGKVDFLYGRLEVRARIPVGGGAWPAIWTLGNDMEWPSCGEIDIMECYPVDGEPSILANAAWGRNRRFDAEWDSSHTPLSHFTAKDKDWASKFHVWRMDWDETAIKLYLDDELLNSIPLSETVNGSIGNHTNPFKRPQYVLLNLAIGGNNGGKIDDSAMPMRYEIDYVRIYKKVK